MNKHRFFSLFGWLLLPLVVCAQTQQPADSLFKKGRFFDERGQMRESALYYGKAYRLYRQQGDTAGWLKAGKEYASSLVYRSRNEQAEKLYKMLLNVEHPANTVYNRGDIYNSLGWSSNRTGDSEEAMKYFQKSLPLSLASGDSLLIGVVYDNLGGTYYDLGNYTKSLELRQKALQYFKGLGNPRSIAITLNNIGLIYLELSLPEKALDYFKRSLKIRKQLNNVHLLATIYDQIAGIQLNLGNYGQSLVAYQKSLEYRKKAGVPQYTASTLNDIGLLYKQLGQYDRALDYYRQSLAISEKAEGSASLATTIRNIAMVLWQKGNYEQAARLYRKSLELRKQTGNPYNIAYSLSDLIRMELKGGDLNQAMKYAGELKAIGDSTRSYNILSDAHLWLGEIEQRQENYQKSLRLYKKAYLYSRFLAPGAQIAPLKKVAEAFHNLNSPKSITFGKRVVRIIEESRSKAGMVSQLKSGYFSRHSDFYIQLAGWVLNYQGDTEMAFRLVEMAKARSLSDELAKAAQNIAEQLPEEVRLERNQKLHYINELYSELEKTKEPGRRGELKRKIRSAELSYVAYENNLYSQYPRLRKLEPPKPLSLEEARFLATENTAILEYAVTENRLIMFLISREGVRVEQFTVAADKNLETGLTAHVSHLRNAILAHASETVLHRHSSELYNILIAPFENDLGKYDRLVIVPDGALAYLPFEVLMRGDRYLIENHSIKYAPSLTSLTLLQPPAHTENRGLFAVAGAQFSPTEEGGFLATSFPILPSTLMEVDSIASHFERPSVLKNKEVSEGKVKEMLRSGDYRFIHFATHGIIDEKYPARSGLALSTRGKLTASSKEDGLLRSSEIFALQLNADLVVLSACNTGLGEVVSGEGILGMQRAFFFAGTSTVVVSLWNVYDRSTAFLMNRFYDFILKDPEIGWMESLMRRAGWKESIPFGRTAEAMRRAKLEMINHPLYNHPVYWAPFIVVGR